MGVAEHDEEGRRACPADGGGEPGRHEGFGDLVRTIWRLRQPDGCPWDRKQTHESIAKNMVEEAYEAVDAIEAKDASHLEEELGDVLMQVVLQAQIAADRGEFTVDDVCAGINEKLIRRHPHVFGEHAAASDAEEVVGIWEQVKLDERKAGASGAQDAGEPPREGLLDSVPTALPALMACQKISRKAAAAGFEFGGVDDVWAKVREEVEEFVSEHRGTPQAEVELGDILFCLVNVARLEGIDAESALRASNAKFRRRWEYMERRAWDSGRDIADLSNEEQEALWAEAKRKEKDQ